jgi:LysR family cys regulon transcriptional activator
VTALQDDTNDYGLVAVHENDLNMTTAARRLHSSQPGVSRQIALLEEELGFQLFERQGRSLIRTTEAGEDIVGCATTILRELQNIRRTSSELANADGGILSIDAAVGGLGGARMSP